RRHRAGVQSQRHWPAVRAGRRAPRLHALAGPGDAGGRHVHLRQLPHGHRLRVDRPAHSVPLAMAISSPPFDQVEALPEREGWLTVARRFCWARPLGAIGAAVIVVMFLVALLAPVLSPYDPVANDFAGMLAAPSRAHWLGTDAFGRDVLSRLIYGSRTALLVGFGASVLGATLGAVLGVASAYFGGRVDLYLQRLMDIFLPFPLII